MGNNFNDYLIIGRSFLAMQTIEKYEKWENNYV